MLTGMTNLAHLVDAPIVYHEELVKIRVHHFYDYPRSLEVSLMGVRYWCEEYPFDSGEYLLLELNDSLWAVIDEMNADFRKYVGSLWEYDPITQKRNMYDQQPHTQENMHAYYDKWGNHPAHDQAFDEGTLKYVVK